MSGSIVDEDTARTINEGRETVGEVVIAARDEFRKVFLVFAVGMVGTVGAMQYYVWEILRGVTEARMSRETSSQYEILVRTPFDVILLQVKIGLVVGVILALPVLLYYSKGGLQRRGIWPDLDVARWKLAGIALLSLSLFAAGGAYAYFVFFPVMFDFLTNYTLDVGFAPNYDVVKWTQFILLLTASFGFAAQLPLVMSALSYLDIVPYETFREKWRYAIMGIFLFGAVFSPPDPFTQIMWAIPLIVLYGVSLYFAKFATAVRRDESAGIRQNLRTNWNRIAGTFVLAAAGVYYFVQEGYVATLNDLLGQAPADYRYEVVLEGLPLAGSELALALGVAWGAAITFAVVVYYGWPQLEPREERGLDIDELTVEGVRAAPAGLFADLSEEEALAYAERAMEEDQPRKARTILDRHDAVSEDETDEKADDADETSDADGSAERPDNMAEDLAGSSADSAGELAQQRTAGIVDAFTEEETTEDDIGGYLDDIMFVLRSLTSRLFRIVGVFMVAMAATFIGLYRGGIGLIKNDFLSRIPEEVLPEGGVDIVALHPVEAILFEVKMSAIVGVVAVLPVIFYYAWPAIEERFHGITREFETAPPLTTVGHHWNQVAGAGVLGAGGAYYAISQGMVALPEGTAVAGVAISATELGYAAVAVAGLVPASVAGGYHAAASVRERVRHGGKQNVFLVWMFTLAGGLVVGSVLGYAFVAPAIISYLVEDAIHADMIIAYRINNFFWLIFATTVGVGLLADVPLTMWLFHRGGIVSYQTMRDRWREVVVAIFGVAAIATPESLLSMFLMSFPVAVAYLVGVAGLWAWTLPRRVRDRVLELA
jgi:sec-independent protein translocase protein TatC